MLTRLFPDSPALRARRDRALTLLFTLLALALIVRAARKDVGVLLHNQQWGARFLQHADPYVEPDTGARIHGPYPPSYALITAPLSLLPTLAARILWCAAQMTALWLFYRLFRARLRRHWPTLAPHATVVFALGLLLVSRYLLRDTAGGGGNLLYTLLAVGGVELALAGRPLPGGAVLALSLVLKPNLACFLVFLALRKRGRALASTAVCALLFFSLPGLTFGPRAYLELTERWARDVATFEQLEDLHTSALVPEGLPAALDGRNQSLREAVHRVLRPPGDSGADDVHVATTTPEVASWIARGLGFAALLAAGLGAWRARGAKAEWLAAQAFLPLAMLLSPVTWKAHHVDLLLALSTLVAVAADDARRRRWLAPLLVGYWVLCDLLSLEVVGYELRNWLQALSVVTWADLVLLAILVRLALRPEPSSPSA